MHTHDLGLTDPVSAPPAAAGRDDILISIRLDDAITAVRADLPRADSQAASMLSLVSGLLVAGLALLAAGRLHGACAGWAWTAVALLGAAVLALTGTLRPRLGGKFGFVRWATLTPGQLVDDLAGGPDPDSATEHLAKARKVTWLSRTLWRKFRYVQLAQTCLLLALAAGVLAALTWTR